jgi:arylsulfatase A-like enzyme
MQLDDHGFNDVSLHGSMQVPTPHIDAIAASGVTLNRYYTQPVCSPTRATVMTGRHAIHHGIYLPFSHGVGQEHLQLNYTLLPTFLARAANYTSHIVGKWHLGANTVSATPTGRGFETYTGYWCGALDYETHQVSGANSTMVYDFHNTTRTSDEALTEAYGTFSTTVFSAAAERIIHDHASRADGRPLFLFLAWQNIHWPLQAPAEYIARFSNTTGGSHERNVVAAMIAFVDDAIGNVTRALVTAGLDERTVVVLVSDNGGPTNGNEGDAASNFPLRGGKNTLWEGGTRVVGMVRGPGVAVGAVSSAYVHASDWLPSLVSMATGGKACEVGRPGVAHMSHPVFPEPAFCQNHLSRCVHLAQSRPSMSH